MQKCELSDFATKSLAWDNFSPQDFLEKQLFIKLVSSKMNAVLFYVSSSHSSGRVCVVSRHLDFV